MKGILEQLTEIAAEQHGLLTVEQAREGGISPGSVRTLAARGALERRSQGLYRVRVLPIGPEAELMEAVLWSGGVGVIIGESAVALWDLADVNPRRVHLGLPAGHRVRRHDSERFRIRHLPDLNVNRDLHRGIPTLTPVAALRDSIVNGLAGDLALQGIHRATMLDLIGEQSAVELRVALDRRGRQRDSA